MKQTDRKLLARIRAAYVQGDGTIKELAERFGVNYFTLRNRSVNEKWSSGKRREPEMVPVEVVPAHFNANLDQTRIDRLAESYLTGGPAPDMARKTLNSAVTRLKTIVQPADCPGDREEWRNEVSRLLGIAVWKMATRLANEADKMP